MKPNPWLDSLIQDARDGDTAAARALAGYMAEYLEKEEEIPPALGKYFAQALRQIGSGDEAGRELHVKGIDKFERDCEIAREVWRLSHRAVDRLPLRLNTRGEGAYYAVARAHGLSPDRVEQIYKGLHWLVEAEALSLEPDEPRPEHWPAPPEHRPEWEEANKRREAAMKLAAAQFVEARNKQQDSSG